MDGSPSKLWTIIGGLLIFLVVGYIGYAEWEAKDRAWASGYMACVEIGHPEQTCRDRVKKHNEVCFDLTETASFFGGQVTNIDLYTQCVIEGPGLFRRNRLAQRRSDRTRTTTTSTLAR